jgi:hypothetical protein
VAISASLGTAGLKQGVCTSTTRPTAPFEGQMIYETDTDMVAVWNGTAWRYIAATTPTNGTVLQVQQTVLNTTTSTTSASVVDVSGFSVSITPKSTSSKVLVTVNLTVGFGSADDTYFNLVRGSTTIAIGSGGTNNNSAFRRGNIISDTGMDTVTIVFLDSPATTSATTYKMQYGTRVGTLYVNRRGSDTAFVTSSTITVQEIAG